MTQSEVIEQLESLLAHCKTMLESGEIWELDCEALNIAIAALRGPTREQVERLWRGEWDYPTCEWNLPKCPKCGCNSKDATYGHKDNFCPRCGAPMTDEAVDIILQRLEALSGEAKAN